MQWLCAHSQNEQENIVKFFIRQAQRVKLVNNMNATFLYYKISGFKKGNRSKIEKKLQCVAEKEVELSNEFPDISECKRM